MTSSNVPGITEWKTALGQRALASVTPPIELTEQRCGSFYLFGQLPFLEQNGVGM